MEILISYQSKKPIYEQIVIQIKKKILEGELKVGTNIPAMRTLAKSLNVSVVTVQKAYEILRDEGFINTIVGKGTFVNLPEIGELKIQKKDELILLVKQVITFAYSNGYTKEEVMEIFREEIEIFNKDR